MPEEDAVSTSMLLCPVAGCAIRRSLGAARMAAPLTRPVVGMSTLAFCTCMPHARRPLLAAPMHVA